MLTQLPSGRSSPCAHTSEPVHARHDGELAPAARRALDAHLAACPACARAARMERRFLARVHGGIALVRAPAALRARVRHAVAAIA